jgi:hypothetical protein
MDNQHSLPCSDHNASCHCTYFTLSQKLWTVAWMYDFLSLHEKFLEAIKLFTLWNEIFYSTISRYCMKLFNGAVTKQDVNTVHVCHFPHIWGIGPLYIMKFYGHHRYWGTRGDKTSFHWNKGDQMKPCTELPADPPVALRVSQDRQIVLTGSVSQDRQIILTESVTRAANCLKWEWHKISKLFNENGLPLWNRQA